MASRTRTTCSLRSRSHAPTASCWSSALRSQTLKATKYGNAGVPFRSSRTPPPVWLRFRSRMRHSSVGSGGSFQRPNWAMYRHYLRSSCRYMQCRALSSFLDLLERAGVDGLQGLPRTAAEIRSPADLLRLMQAIRRQLSANPSAVSTVMARLRSNDARDGTPEQRATIAALTDLYAGRETAYLNFYGPPGTICSVAYDRILALSSDQDAGCPLRDSIVFVGLAHDRVARADQRDTYHTVYQSGDGVDFSGVELHATAVSNLLMRTALHTPPPVGYFALMLLLGGCFGAGGYWARTRKRRVRGAFPARLQAGVELAGLAIIYCGIAYVLFRNYNFAIPLVVPMATQFPTALILALLVPPTRYQEQVKAVCLSTDAEGSTAIGQNLSNEEYARLIRDYHEALTQPVWNRGGSALAPEGDGFASVWCGDAVRGVDVENDSARRLQACIAALEIVEAAKRFNLAST